MPSTSGMRRGFNLRRGEKIGQAIIASIEMGHETKKKYQTYEYPCTIQFQGKESDLISKSWKRNIGTNSRIIHSEYGSPYECWFQEPEGLCKGENDTIVMTVKAIANRRRDIPTLRQTAKQKVPEGQADEIEALKPNYRVVPSHFATSRCRLCQDVILPGQMIAKPDKNLQTDRSIHGWNHVDCLAKALNVVKGKRSEEMQKQGRRQTEAKNTGSKITSKDRKKPTEPQVNILDSKRKTSLNLKSKAHGELIPKQDRKKMKVSNTN